MTTNRRAEPGDTSSGDRTSAPASAERDLSEPEGEDHSFGSAASNSVSHRPLTVGDSGSTTGAATRAGGAARAAKQTAARRARQSPGGTAAQTPARRARQSPGGAAKQTPAPAAEQTPAGAAKQTPAPAAEQTPAGAAKQTPAPAAEQTPAGAAKQTPAPTAEQTPARTAKQAPGGAAQRTPAGDVARAGAGTAILSATTVPTTADRSGGSTNRTTAAVSATAASPTGTAAGADWHGSRARVPGLDGVRALAVLAVIAFHLGMRAAPGGFLGVDVFFVLSGYLITDLLATAHGRGLDLRGFWLRRARRLLPALALMLVVVTATATVIEPGQLAALRPALAAAVTYSSNWYQAYHHVSYFASFGPPPPLQHLWSLAIEEQFYLAWPLLLMIILARLRSRHARALAAWAGAAASAAAMALLYVPGGDPSRVYYGTDTHATALLTGAALALTWPLAMLAGNTGRLARRVDVLGIAGLAALAWAVGHYRGSDPSVYPYGLAVAALAAAGLVAAAAARGTVGRMLSASPLRWLGVRSYGIYLWHWPVIALTAAITGPRQSAWLWAMETVAAIGLAAASWKWVEQPILRNGFRASCRSFAQAFRASATTNWRSPRGTGPAVAAVAGLAVACTAGYGVLYPPAATSSGVERQIARGERVSAASRAHADQRPVGPTRPAAARVPSRVRGRQVTAIGDSVMLASAPQLQAALPGIYIDAQVSRQIWVGLQVVRRLAERGRLRPVVVVGLGTNGTVTSAQLRELVHLVGLARKLVLINTYEARSWERGDNAVIAATAHRYPNVVLANWHATIDHHTSLLWPDEVHPRPPGAKLYARMVYRAVQATRYVPAQQQARPAAAAQGPGHPRPAAG